MTNRATLAQLHDMTGQQAAALPTDQIAHLLEAVGELKAEAKRLDETLHEAMTIRYADKAAAARRDVGKDTGTINLTDGEWIVRADLPKRVEWDESALADAETKLRDMGEDPTEYLKVKRVVSESAYNAWPSSLRSLFEPARTVGVGRATYKMEPMKTGGRGRT